MTVRADWRKSSHSGLADDSDCVEVGRLAEGVGVRDSKLPEAGNLVLPSGVFADLVGRIKGGESGL